jgi:hypothetical protein
MAALVLLLVAPMSSAQNSGTLEDSGHKMSYSVLGGTLKQQWGPSQAANNMHAITKDYSFEATPVTTISGSITRVAGELNKANIDRGIKKQEIEDGTYVIRFTHNPEYVLMLKDGKAVNNNVIHLWKWQNTNAQKWKVTHKDGKIAIRSAVDPNYVLDVKSFNYSNNTDIILYKYLGNDNQLWIPERLDNGAYILKTAGNPTFCLDLYKGNATNGGKIELYNAQKLWPEWWTLEKVSK